ncbi:unnamed protein product [Urochloa humidicola]
MIDDVVTKRSIQTSRLTWSSLKTTTTARWFVLGWWTPGRLPVEMESRSAEDSEDSISLCIFISDLGSFCNAVYSYVMTLAVITLCKCHMYDKTDPGIHVMCIRLCL